MTLKKIRKQKITLSAMVLQELTKHGAVKEIEKRVIASVVSAGFFLNVQDIVDRILKMRKEYPEQYEKAE